jgi:hypothetical protein
VDEIIKYLFFNELTEAVRIGPNQVDFRCVERTLSTTPTRCSLTVTGSRVNAVDLSVMNHVARTNGRISSLLSGIVTDEGTSSA